MIADVFQPNEFPSPRRIAAMREYIKKTWKTLYRSHAHILEAAKDEKIGHTDEQRWPIYISAMEDKNRVEAEFKSVLSSEEFQQLEIMSLPSEIDQITEHGLLYLPGDYVVPGGRFNEMYGWDSYFIVLGLLRDGEIELAKSQVDQLIYQIAHYGTILNANRSYLLSRSQPPFLTPMILAVYEHTQDKDWLRSLLGAVESHYYYWIVPPHLNQSTGLSRYCALGEGPAPEVLVSETDAQGRTHYDRIREYYRRFEVMAYDVSLYYNKETDTLTDLFYKGDRSMRESGFDPSNRFGPFNIDIIHYAPVCLNALLYRMEQDIAKILTILGNSQLAESWCDRAQTRQQLIDKFLWDEPSGLYLDYNFRTNERRLYEFATTFYPLWVGLASEKQAQRVVENLELFEAPGGLLTSSHVTGNQWDAPFGWAPLNLIAVEGLYRYGYRSEGDRIGGKFINLVTQEFEKTGTLLEKYDVLSCSSEVSNEIVFGYNTNEIGFGWTNGSILELLAQSKKM
ncbi:trehalase family glycosidase [Laspinema olomoucense]|uniref:trehalase family glycosidase n=1 Tax=Laspinema olomoucense TaxID=3231600 RepID=UPI0021BB741C|nr:trehalase family glycosidase [Laspinema sp. D3c]MCT7992873.1 alpha,alpha-trehalase [Laspinema sp. D3c]